MWSPVVIFITMRIYLVIVNGAMLVPIILVQFRVLGIGVVAIGVLSIIINTASAGKILLKTCYFFKLILFTFQVRS